MKIGIITIATGGYVDYVESLIDSCDLNLLNGHDKSYFIFTDGGFTSSIQNVHRIKQKKLGWPFDTMMRFHMFTSIRKQLEEMDYIFFLNANMLIIEKVGDEILPNEHNQWLVATKHPGYIDKHPYYMPFEKNAGSVFFTAVSDKSFYVQGCFNGGRSKEYLEMSEILKNMIDTDIKNNVIPIWHDESALNWYLNDKNPLRLDPTYSYPKHCLKHEMEKLISDYPEIYNAKLGSEFSDQISAALGRYLDPYARILEKYGDAKIIQRDKMMMGGHDKLRGNFK